MCSARMHLTASICMLSLFAMFGGASLLNDSSGLAPFGSSMNDRVPEVPHDGVRVLQPLEVQACQKNATASFLKSSVLAKKQHELQHRQRQAFACVVGCSAREPQLEESLAPWADWKQNSTGLDMLDALEGFCKKRGDSRNPFVLTVLWEQDVYVKSCVAENLQDPSLYLIGPEDLSLVLIFLLSAQRLATLPDGPIAFGMYLSDYTSLLDRHLVGPGLPIFAYLGRATSWLIPWPSSFTVLSTLDVEEWEKEQSESLVLASSAHTQGNSFLGTSKQKPWKDRESKAYWIGAITGPWEFAVDSGLMAIPRLKLLKLSKDHPKQIQAEWSSTAGYGISWVADDEKVSGFLAPRSRSVKELTGIAKAEYKEASAWDNFKYYINLDGVVLGGRLNKLLSLGGVVLQHQAGYTEHIDALVKPYEHYVPIEYDLSDLVAKIEWLQRNDAEAKRIAYNAKKIASERMRLEDHLCYVWRALEALGTKTASAKADDDTVKARLKGYRRIVVKEGGMRPTLEAFWGDKLEKVKTGDRVMSDRGLEMLKWSWERFEALFAKVETYK